ncbi:MAG: type II toxin-antitoxin system VapB family antitoxin [Brachymonas sp.]|nr:type II toxin-antitoxin system VapB family antitoxin [Brachymonas sp.]
MATNLAIDDSLLEQARKVSGLRTKKAVVTHALVEYIQKRQQSQVIELFGSIDYDAHYDYKAQRKAGRGSSPPAAPLAAPESSP